MPTTKKPAAKKAPVKKPEAKKPTITKAQLKKAAAMRDKGATWGAIREATGTKLGSSAWFRAWEREGIEHRPAGTPKPAAEAKAAE